jgi:ATP phosphoribosyltransferase regulatory subunit
MDLRELVRIAPAVARPGAILAPAGGDAALRAAIERLRGAGETVIQELPGHDATRHELGCERRLAQRGGKWVVEAS